MAPKVEFVTLPDELVECAIAVRDHYKDWGFKTTIEPDATKAGYPFTPAMVCKKADRTIVVEVDTKADRARLIDWANYCASCDRNRELILCVPPKTELGAGDLGFLAGAGIGLLRADSNTTTEMLLGRDLAMRAVLPEAANLPSSVRSALADTYQQWGRGNWKESFGLATEALEDEAKRYLIRETGRGRAVILDKKGSPQVHSAQSIGKSTLGGLAVSFSRISAPTDVDSTLATALTTVNGDRVRLRHYRKQKATSAGFRRRVGPHMHMIVRALKEALATK